VDMGRVYHRRPNRKEAGRVNPPVLPRMCMRPLRACSSALRMMSIVMPLTLMSICRALMPVAVPGRGGHEGQQRVPCRSCDRPQPKERFGHTVVP